MLKDIGCQVSGVEIDPVAAAEARAFCEEVAVEDLNTLDLARRFDQRFDVVLMLDVLEHLTDPISVLRRVSSVLADGGWAVISLPNVAHVSVRLALLGGQFKYTDVGLLDRTHLRFFDRNGVDDLLRDAGWGLFDMARVTHRFGTTEIRVENADPQLIRQLESDTEALTYQYVISAAPLGSVVHERPPVLPAALAQAVALDVFARNEALQAASRVLDQELSELRHDHASLRVVHEDLQEELDRLRNTKLLRWAAPARRVYTRLRANFQS